MTGGEGGERFRVGGDQEKGREGEEGGREKKGKERAIQEGEKEEAVGLCGCLGVCRCGSN